MAGANPVARAPSIRDSDLPTVLDQRAAYNPFAQLSSWEKCDPYCLRTCCWPLQALAGISFFSLALSFTPVLVVFAAGNRGGDGHGARAERVKILDVGLGAATVVGVTAGESTDLLAAKGGKGSSGRVGVPSTAAASTAGEQPESGKGVETGSGNAGKEKIQARTPVGVPWAVGHLYWGVAGTATPAAAGGLEVAAPPMAIILGTPAEVLCTSPFHQRSWACGGFEF